MDGGVYNALVERGSSMSPLCCKLGVSVSVLYMAFEHNSSLQVPLFDWACLGD